MKPRNSKHVTFEIEYEKVLVQVRKTTGNCVNDDKVVVQVLAARQTGNLGGPYNFWMKTSIITLIIRFHLLAMLNFL